MSRIFRLSSTASARQGCRRSERRARLRTQARTGPKIPAFAEETLTQNRRGNRPHFLLSCWLREHPASPIFRLLLLKPDTTSCTVRMFLRRPSSNFYSSCDKDTRNQEQERRHNFR